MSRPIPLTIAALSMLVWLIVLSWIAEKGLRFGGVPPVPLQGNPILITAGIICALVVVALHFVRPDQSAKARLLRGASLPLAIMGVTLFVASIHQGRGAIAARETLIPRTIRQPAVFAIPVIFANASPEIAPSERRRIMQNVAVFRDCEANTVFIRGFASSAAFRDENAYRNLTLANNRALAVQRVIQEETGLAPQVKTWTNFDEMMAERRIRDLDAAGGRVLVAEELNRRAEIFWNDSHCISLGLGR